MSKEETQTGGTTVPRGKAEGERLGVGKIERPRQRSTVSKGLCSKSRKIVKWESVFTRLYSANHEKNKQCMELGEKWK